MRKPRSQISPLPSDPVISDSESREADCKKADREEEATLRLFAKMRALNPDLIIRQVLRAVRIRIESYNRNEILDAPLLQAFVELVKLSIQISDDSQETVSKQNIAMWNRLERAEARIKEMRAELDLILSEKSLNESERI